MWWVALAFTLALMALFRLLTAAGPLEARATLALGFLMLVAHLGGELAKRVRLPRITGFLLTGIAVGPAWLGLVRGDEVDALRFISDGAVALIAFTAGSRLNLAMLRQGRVMLARLTLGATLLPFATVAAVVLTVSPWFPLTVHQPFGDAMAVALVLGVIAAASSPALTMALMDELNAGTGSLARAVLSVSVAKDVLVIVLFTLLLANGRLFMSPGALVPDVAGPALLQVAGSIAAGAALGYAVARFLGVIERHTALLLVVLAFFTAELARLAGLETMLIAVAAGFYLENFAPVQAQRLRGELKQGALPVYVVFFALAGAGLQVESLAELWPWVLLLVAVRALGLRLGTRWAARSAEVPGDLAHNAWLGLVSQAGLALGVAALAREAFPEWGVSLETLVVAMIGVHEIAGPICFRRALRLAGEVTEEDHVAETVAAGEHSVPVGGSGVH